MNKIGQPPQVGQRVIAYREDGSTEEGVYEKPVSYKYGRLRTEPDRFIYWSMFVGWEAAPEES